MKNINILLIGILLGILVQSCEEEQVRPSISQAKMAKILVDVHLAESSINTFPLNQKDSIAIAYYKHIFRIHEISEKDYYKNLQLYLSNTDSAIPLYDEVTRILDAMQEKDKNDRKSSVPRNINTNISIDSTKQKSLPK